MENIKLINILYYLLPTYISHRNTSSLSDTGASGHYLKANAPRNIAIQPVAPIKVNQPNGQIIQSTKGFRLTSATLPDE